MAVVGAIWAVGGGAMLYRLDLPAKLFEEGDDDLAVILALACFATGLLLLKTGIWQERVKPFEQEIPDAYPDLTNEVFWD